MDKEGRGKKGRCEVEHREKTSSAREVAEVGG